MKVLLDVADYKAPFVMELLSNFSFVKAQPISKENSKVLDEVSEIKKAFKSAALIKKGKLKTRPIEELLNEL